jgi:hypothetical protein
VGGPTGAQGAQGAQGFQGPQGPQGPMGPTSDQRLKKNIEKLRNNTEKLLKLESVQFTWDSQNDKVKELLDSRHKDYYEKDSLGFVAQELEMVVPEVVWTEEDGYKKVEYGLIVALCIGSIQEQHKKLNSIIGRINSLKKMVGA